MKSDLQDRSVNLKTQVSNFGLKYIALREPRGHARKRKMRQRRLCAKSRELRQMYSAYGVRYEYITPLRGLRSLRVSSSKTRGWEKVNSHIKFCSSIANREKLGKHLGGIPGIINSSLVPSFMVVY